MSARAWSPLTLLLLAACTSSSNASDGGLYDAPRDDAPDAATDVTTEDVSMDAPPDVASDVASGDAGGCVIPGYGTCAPSSTCVVARCPDGTPVSCFCSADSMPRCTGACPPLDGGAGGTIECGGARGLASPPACAPTRAVLDPQLCRCILGWVQFDLRGAG